MGAMTLYARPSWRLVGQVASDAFVIAWSVAWWFVGRLTDTTIRALANPARATAQTASDLQRQLADAAQQVGGIVAIGDGLRQPFDAMSSTLGRLIASASEQVAGVENTATLVGLVVFAMPTLLAVALWLPGRVRFATRTHQLKALAADPNDVDLLALRALAHGSPADLALIASDPVSAWRRGDAEAIGRLAALELRRAGLRR